MNIEKKIVLDIYKNTFKQIATKSEEVEIITCNKEEFLKLLEEKPYKIVKIKRTTASEFLFDKFADWEKEDAKWIIGNLQWFEDAQPVDKLDTNDRLNDEICITD